MVWIYTSASQVALVVKSPPAETGDIRDLGSVPGLGRSPGAGNGNSLQYSCLENPMDRGAWQATVLGITKELDTTEATQHDRRIYGHSFHFKLSLGRNFLKCFNDMEEMRKPND